MNKPIEIVLNAATIEYVTATWKDLSVADGIMTIGERYGFPWKKLFDKNKVIAVTEVDAIQNAKITAVAAGIEYSFILTQRVGGDLIVERIAYTASTGDTYTNVSAGWKAIVDAHAASGRIKVASTAISTVTNADDVLTITSADGYALMSVSNASNSVTLNIAGATTGVAAVNAGADLLAGGIKDSFDATVPTAGASYTSYELTLMLPKGSGGFNEQTSDQEHTLMLYVDQAGTPSGHFIVDLDNLLNGVNATNNTVTGLLSELLAV
jgi:hypothetical protein